MMGTGLTRLGVGRGWNLEAVAVGPGSAQVVTGSDHRLLAGDPGVAGGGAPGAVVLGADEAHRMVEQGARFASLPRVS